MLTLSQLSCIRNDRCLFSDVSITVQAGEILHLKGENGVGKSSLLQILAGLLLPTDGQILWQGQSIHSHILCYLGHKQGVKLGLTVDENVRFSAMLMEKNLPIQMASVLSFFKLETLQHIPVHLLSAGQKQRLALTRLLITDAMLWILDEPFNAIDEENTKLLKGLFQQHVDKGGIIILTSHHPLDLPGVREHQLWLSGESLI